MPLTENVPNTIVELYRAFYRADRNYNPSARKSIQPLLEACEVICKADASFRSPETLTDMISGRVAKLMQQCRNQTALGRCVIKDPAEERQAILAFSRYFVENVFYAAFGGDMARFAGRQQGLLEDNCEFLYRTIQDSENAIKERLKSSES